MDKEELVVVEVDEDNYVSSITINGQIPEEQFAKLPDAEFQDCYKYIDNEFIKDEEKYNKKLRHRNIALFNINIQKLIFNLKKDLSNSDYKIIKCYEAQLVGEESPYDIVELHAERESIRNQINQLEETLQ